LVVAVLTYGHAAQAQDPSPTGDAAPPPQGDSAAAAPASDNAGEAREPAEPPAPPKLPPPATGQRLSPDSDVWIDKQQGIVMVDGQVTLRRGPLEMFACTKGTKEHESIVACPTKAFVVHAALLNVGAETGTPVRYDDRYHPPTGTEIDIEIYWVDEKGQRQKAKAQSWIRDARTDKEMNLSWVFAGSGFWKDEESGQNIYLAESGDFICVSNFSTAMLDVPAESTQANDGLMYEAFTDRIPPLGTWVRLVLRPKLAANDSVTKPDTPAASGTPAAPTLPESDNESR
jgi:hypothetical protein